MQRLSLRAARSSHVRLNIHRPWQFAPPATTFRKSFTTSSTQLDEPRDNSPPKVRWFNQFFPWTSRQEPIDPKNEDADEEESVEGQILKAKIERLEGELDQLRGEHVSTIEPLLKVLSKEDRAKVRAALRQAELDDPDGDTVDADAIKKLHLDTLQTLDSESPMEYGADQGDLEIDQELPPAQDVHLRRLNKCLLRAARETSDPKVRKALWQSYVRCKYHKIPFMRLVPDEAWDVLWASQSAVATDDAERAFRLCILSNDILASGKELSFDQGITFVESLSHEGDLEEAICQWQRQRRVLSQNEQSSFTYRSLGVRLFATQGDAQRAQQMAMQILDERTLDGQKDRSRILIPIIEAWARIGTEKAIRNAWALYLRLRTLLGLDLNIQDYDCITLCFLKLGRTDIALAVFKDLMLTGKRTEYDSIQLYRKSHDLIGQLQAHSTDAFDVNKASMTALTVLPRTFQNKFFYASWLKKLIGMGEVDAAGSVLELMYERNVPPDAKHLNGILGAWLRSGTARDREKAEKVGWTMIQQRLNFVNRRRSGLVTLTDFTVPIPERIKRTVPPATIETFSLLLLYYSRRSLLPQVQLLKENLSLCEIHPNVYYMNHLLYADLRGGEHRKSWKTYQQMSREVNPDLETFACLWQCEKSHLDRLTIYSSDHFPGPRRILSDMMSWYGALRRATRNTVFKEFTKDLYDQVIRCFCLAKDLEGTMVALYVLRNSFSSYPDQDTSRMITLKVASLGLNEPKTRKPRRSRLFDHPHSKANIAKITQALVLMARQRAEVLKQKGVRLGEHDGRRCKEEHLYLLAEFVRVILRRETPDELEVEKRIDQAAWDMGFGGIRMVDPLLNA